MKSVTVHPLRDDGFGAKVIGATDVSLADDDARRELNDAFERHGLLVFEDVESTPQMQVAISTVFGPLKEHPSKATPRVGGDEMVGVIEIRHDPDVGGMVQVAG